MESTGGRFSLKGLSKRGQYILFLSVASPLKALGDSAAQKWLLTQHHRSGPGKPLWGVRALPGLLLSSRHTDSLIFLDPQTLRSAGLRTLEMEGTSEICHRYSSHQSSHHVILSWLCFIFPAIPINHVILMAYFPLWSGLKIEVHYAPSAPWASARLLRTPLGHPYFPFSRWCHLPAGALGHKSRIPVLVLRTAGGMQQIIPSLWATLGIDCISFKVPSSAKRGDHSRSP